MENWTDFNSEIHQLPQQLKKQEKAKKADMTPYKLDRENQTAVFVHSSTYNTSLTGCTCRNFILEGPKLPCKHMYRLAMELGLFKADFKTDNEYAKKQAEKPKDYITKETVTKYIFRFSPQAQKILCDLSATSKYNDFTAILPKSPYIEELTSTNFCKTQPITWEMFSNLNVYKMRELLSCVETPTDKTDRRRAASILKQYAPDSDALMKTLNEHYVFVSLTEGAVECHSTIYKRYYGRFKRFINEYGMEDVQQQFIQEN